MEEDERPDESTALNVSNMELVLSDVPEPAGPKKRYRVEERDNEENTHNVSMAKVLQKRQNNAKNYADCKVELNRSEETVRELKLRLAELEPSLKTWNFIEHLVTNFMKTY